MFLVSFHKIWWIIYLIWNSSYKSQWYRVGPAFRANCEMFSVSNRGQRGFLLLDEFCHSVNTQYLTVNSFNSKESWYDLSKLGHFIQWKNQHWRRWWFRITFVRTFIVPNWKNSSKTFSKYIWKNLKFFSKFLILF